MCLANCSSVSGTISIPQSNETSLDNSALDDTINSLPEHVDDPFLNRDVVKGILGFYYETKSDSLIVYSTPESKTFALLMKIKPLK